MRHQTSDNQDYGRFFLLALVPQVLVGAMIPTCKHGLIAGPRMGQCHDCWYMQPGRAVIHRRSLPRPLTDKAERILAAIKAEEPETPSIRELVKSCGLSSNSVALHCLRQLAKKGLIQFGPKGQARSYRLTPLGRGAPSAEERVIELENGLRTIRRWIEGEDRPGDRTMDIYNLTAVLLPY